MAEGPERRKLSVVIYGATHPLPTGMYIPLIISSYTTPITHLPTYLPYLPIWTLEGEEEEKKEGADDDNGGKKPKKKKVIMVEDVHAFKRTHPLYPLRAPSAVITTPLS